MTSCTPNTLSCGGSGGCMGSVTQLGFNYLQLFGSVKEEDWPYVSGTTGQWHKYHGDCKCIKCRMWFKSTPNSFIHILKLIPLYSYKYFSTLSMMTL